ncbi:MAG: FeoB-associated Cys-rich membrane protein [Lachnospiraceae bacterium]|jgi:hypothetical protein|nr:FeoB-associated Cys-rich membrane protein [Lachnospiraceae bacterium]
MNLPTLIVLIVVAAAAAAVITYMVRRRRFGGCGCGCSDCPMKNSCGKPKKTKNQIPGGKTNE